MQLATSLAVAPGTYGTDALQRLLTTVFKSLPLDRDGDGKISSSERNQALFTLVPALLDADLIRESGDLTLQEAQHLLEWVDQYFPELTGLKASIERLVAALAAFLAAGVEVWLAVQALQDEKDAELTNPVAGDAEPLPDPAE